MKISELKSVLDEMLISHGDVPVVVWDSERGEYTEDILVDYFKDGHSSIPPVVVIEGLF